MYANPLWIVRRNSGLTADWHLRRRHTPLASIADLRRPRCHSCWSLMAAAATSLITDSYIVESGDSRSPWLRVRRLPDGARRYTRVVEAARKFKDLWSDGCRSPLKGSMGLQHAGTQFCGASKLMYVLVRVQDINPPLPSWTFPFRRVLQAPPRTVSLPT